MTAKKAAKKKARERKVGRKLLLQKKIARAEKRDTTQEKVRLEKVLKQQAEAEGRLKSREERLRDNLLVLQKLDEEYHRTEEDRIHLHRRLEEQGFLTPQDKVRAMAEESRKAAIAADSGDNPTE